MHAHTNSLPCCLGNGCHELDFGKKKNPKKPPKSPTPFLAAAFQMLQKAWHKLNKMAKHL